MDPSWNPAFEGIITFEKVREHDEHLPALIWSTGINHILSTVKMDLRLSVSNIRIGARTHRICPPEMEGVMVQEFQRGRNLLSVGT